MTSCIERRINMAHKDQQTGATGSSQEQRAEIDERTREAMREDARTAFSQQEARDIGERTRDTMVNAVSTTERIGNGLADGVANVAGGVIGAVRDTANTAIDGVGSVGQHAVHTLTDLLVGVVGGVRQVAGAAVGGVRSTAQEAFRPRDGWQQRPEELSEAQEVRREQAQPKRETAGEQASIH
jgi:hypothetical protein